MFKIGHIYYIFCSYTRVPHEKISVCVCEKTPAFFWINSDPCFHGEGQEPVSVDLCPQALKYDSHLDLSGLRQYAPKDLAKARDCGMMTDAFRELILAALKDGNDMLSEAHQAMAYSNLTPPAANPLPTDGLPSKP